MRIYKQKNLHNPENNIWGDCHRTCLAMILDMDRDYVPNFAEQSKDDGQHFNRLVENWLRLHGFSNFSVPFAAKDWQEVGSYMLNVNPGVFYILGGTSRTGVNHSVVAVNDTIVADPSLRNSGIVGPCNDGYFWVSVLIPIEHTVSGHLAHNHNADPNYVGLTEASHD